MKNFIKEKNGKYLIGVFFFVLILSFLTPISGDDWGNYLVGARGIKASIQSAIFMYYHWEGRFISRIFLNVFTYYKYLWCFLNAFQITGILYFSYKIIKPKNKKAMLILPILGIFLVPCDFYTQNYLWLAGNMTYLTPTFLSLLVFTYFYQLKEVKFKTPIFILLLILSFIIPMFVENIGCAYVFGLFLWIVYYFYKKRKISKALLAMLITSLISLMIMLLSPGSVIRMQESIEFNKLNFLEKIFSNLSNFIYYVFNKNVFLLIFMMIPVNIFINKKLKTSYKKIILIIFNSIPILSILQNIFYMIPLDVMMKIRNYNGIFLTSHWYFIFYWCLFGLLFLISIYDLLKDKEEALKTLILTITAIVSSLVMLLTPVWGDRVTAFCTLTLLFVSLKLINETVEISSTKTRILKIFLILTLLYYSLVSIYHFIFNLRREEQIKKSIQEQAEVVYLYYNRDTLLWNYMPWTSYHEKTFKNYYGIKDSVSIKIVTPTIKETYRFIVYGEYRKE